MLLEDVEQAASLHQNLVAQIRKMLVEGELTGEQRIPEAQLCARFSVSRTPLREALKVLAAEGFILLRPNRGAVVAPIDPSLIAPIFELKGALERLIGLTVAVRATDEDITALNTLHEALGEALKQGALNEYTNLNYIFHRRISQISRNSELIQSYDNLQQKIWRYRFLVNGSRPRLQESHQEHEEIMIALRARTPLDLAARLERHNLHTGEAMEEAAWQALGGRMLSN